MTNTGVIIGRFQPMHKGHLDIIKKASNEFEEVIIVIGSKNKSRTFKNPLTYEEREEILKNVLKKESITNFKLLGLDDNSNDKEWIKNLKELVIDYNVIISGNKIIKDLLNNETHEVREPEFLDIEEYNSTNVRKRIRANKKWKHLVPKLVYSFIMENALAEEISSLT